VLAYILIIFTRISLAGTTDRPLDYQQYHALNITGGIFYGPGQMPDSLLPKGMLGHIEFRQQLVGTTNFFNNGPEPPNVPGEVEIIPPVDGLMSNGQAFNEHVDGGIASVGLGAMRFLIVVAAGGPNQGRETYELQPDYNWEIITDLALDPGFAEGIVISNNLHITSGIRFVPKSLQTSGGILGGDDRSGSLPSGVPVIGRMGDYDMDGFLDGIVVGVSNIPLDHMFLPGAPVTQIRYFISDIPITPFDASLLVLASINNYQPVWNRVMTLASSNDLVGKYMNTHLTHYLEDIVSRCEMVDNLLVKALEGQIGIDRIAITKLRNNSKTKLVAATHLLDWSKKKVDSNAIPPEISERAIHLFEEVKKMTEIMGGLSTLKPKSITSKTIKRPINPK